MANSHHSKEKYLQIANKLRGQKRNKETLEKMSKARKGYKHSDETLAKMRKPRSEQGKLNISKACKGRIPWNKGKTNIYSEEVIKNIRDNVISFYRSKNPNYVEPTYESNERSRKLYQTRMNRINTNGGSHTLEQWEHLKAAYNYTCNICKKTEPEIKLTKDHIISVKNGGTNDIGNIQPLCRLAIQGKDNYILPEQFKPNLIYGENPEEDNA